MWYRQILVFKFLLCLTILSVEAQETDKVERESSAKASLQTVYPSEQEELPHLPLSYRWRRFFWENFDVLLFKTSLNLNQNSLQAPSHIQSELVTWAALDSRTPLENLRTARHIPRNEGPFLRSLAASAIYYLRTFYPPTARNLPSIPTSVESIKHLLSEKYSRYIDFPSFPEEMQKGAETGDMVGALSLKGPFSHYISQLNPFDRSYMIDLSEYEQWPVKEGLCRLGGKAVLKYNPETQQMETETISYQGQNYTKDSGSEWEQKQKIMLMTMSTDISITRHLLYTHACTAGIFSAVNNLYLSDNHPLRILMYPHQHLTLAVNNTNLKLLFGNESGFFPSIFSYNRETILKLVNQKIQNFNISFMDIEKDLQKRYMIGTQSDGEFVPYPYAKNTLRLRSLISNHVKGYLDLYYADDQALQEDETVKSWYEALNIYIPNGIKEYVSEISKENLTKLITTFLYTASVEHENVGNVKMHYGIWHQYIPTQVAIDPSKLPSVDLLHQYMDLSFLTSVPSFKVVDDFSFLGLDEKGKNSLKQFSEAMKSYQQELDQQPFNFYTIYPKNLETSVSS